MTIAITTQTTEQTLDIIESWLAAKMPLRDAQDFVTDLLEQAIVAIEAAPLQYPVDPSAQRHGIQLRRWINAQGNYLCLYRYNPHSDIALLDIFASTRQDWLSLLYLVQISRP